MSLQDILNSIKSDSKDKIAEIEKQGLAEKDTLEKQWQEKLQTEQVALRERLATDVGRKVKSATLKLKMSAQSKVLLTKQQSIDEVFSAALDKLALLSESDYISVLARLLADLPTDKGSLHSVKGKSDWLKKALAKQDKKFDIENKEVDGVGGFVLSGQDFSVDNRFESILESLKDELRVEVGKILFNHE
jgi:V/A-type H+/Na+-transporting ATPase subunit E